MIDPSLAIRLILSFYRYTERRIRLIGSADWPMADGKITGANVKRDEVLGWRLELSYYYTALGEYYAGKFQRSFRRKASAEAFAERFPKQTPVPVRYKPERPQVSTLLLSDLTLYLAGL